jgi:hypothetical protein
MQVFRIMGLPDKVIAFDELPERFLAGFEMIRADGFPRHWKEFLGKRKKITPIPPEKDLLTGQVRRFDPIVEEDSFFFLVDKQIGPSIERWKEVCDFLRQHVDKEIRLRENIEDMALPLAPDKTSSVTLEPEDVPIVPIPLEYQEKGTQESPKVEERKPTEIFDVKCDECKAEYTGPHAKQALRMHKMKKHSKEKVA